MSKCTLRGIERTLRSSCVKLSSINSGTLHQWSGTSVMNSWLKAQNPHGRHAGRHTSQSRSFWYKPNSPIFGKRSSRSMGSSFVSETYNNRYVFIFHLLQGLNHNVIQSFLICTFGVIRPRLQNEIISNEITW